VADKTGTQTEGRSVLVLIQLNQPQAEKKQKILAIGLYRQV
tara:strand:- start:413 stop:535 length:123 start_codon:yes stop_codon:yes gene_type:complete